MKEFRPPAALGKCADLLFTLKAERAKAQKVVDALAKKEQAVKNYIIETLPKSEASGVAGKLARVSIHTKTVPTPVDWDAFYKYVKKTGQFQLMQRRLSEAAIGELWDAGKKVPGVDRFNVKTVSLTKL